MKLSTEEKILQALIDKVIDKDRDIKNRHEAQALKEATFETLTEMTELSKVEIKSLEEEIRAKFLSKSKRKRKLFFIYGLTGIIVILLLYVIFFAGKYYDKVVFTENFDNTQNGWKTYNDFIYNKYIDDGKFIFSTDVNDQSFSQKLNIKLPISFTAEITTNLLRGSQEDYGVKINMAFQKSFDFAVRSDYKAYVNSAYTSAVDPWVKFPLATDKGKHTVIQKIIAKPFPKEKIYNPFKGVYVYLYKKGKYEYFVNDKLIKEQKYDDPIRGLLSLYVNGSQSVSYEWLKITDNFTGKTVFNGPFSDCNELLNSQFEYNVMSSIENGSYLFKTNKPEKCYRSTIPYDLKKKTKINLISRWLGGETYYYGMIAGSDDENFYAFELKSDGTACFIKQVDGDNEIFIDNIKTGIIDMRNKNVEQSVFFNGSLIEYYINGKLIHSNEHTLKDLQYIGFRVCGCQQVAFEKLEIRE